MRYSLLGLRFLISIMVLLFVFFVGFRPDSLGSDTKNYIVIYDNYQVVNFNLEFLFFYLLDVFHHIHLPVEYFLSFISVLTFVMTALMSKQLSTYFSNEVTTDRVFLYLMCFLCISPFFLAGQVNVIRQGVACIAVILFYISFISRANIAFLLAILFVAFGFHRSSMLYVAFFPLIFLSYPLVFSTICFTACLYITGLSELVLEFISQISSVDLYHKILNYEKGSQYQSGIRWDFALFSMAAGCVFHLLAKTFLPQQVGKHYFLLLKVYWILILPFFLFGFAAFSDRYLLVGWIYLSILGGVFASLYLKKMNISLRVLLLLFFYSSLYYLFRLNILDWCGMHALV